MQNVPIMTSKYNLWLKALEPVKPAIDDILNNNEANIMPRDARDKMKEGNNND